MAVKTTLLEPVAANGTVTLGASGDTISIPSGVTLANSGTATGFGGGTNTPAFSAKLGSNLTMNSASTVYDVVFNTELFDVGSCYNASNGIFTVPSGEGGKYFFSTSCMFSDSGGTLSDFLIYMHSTIGGSANQDLVARAQSTSDGALFTQRELAYTTVLTLSAGDAIKIQVYQQTNNNATILLKGGGRNTVFSGFKIIE